jgi:hypothetical protein
MMNNISWTLAFLLLWPLLPSLAAVPADKPVPVRLAREKGGWRLLRGDRPYFIKGAGGGRRLDLLAASGGNSVRTWGADEAAKVLDDAQRNGLTVTIGLWLGHKEHGFRYDDPVQVRAQREKAREYVLRYRNHPALLMWAVGNEMEGDGKDPKVWQAVEEIARLIKSLDPAHPTITVVAELGADGVKPRQVAALCPSIDVLGVNSYGGMPSVPK